MIDDIGDASEARSSSGNEWQGDDEEDDNDNESEGDAMSEDDSIMDGETTSLVVQLKYGNREAPSSLDGPGENSRSEKPEVEARGEAESASVAKIVPRPTQEPFVYGPPGAMQEDLSISDSKGLHTPTIDNTGVGEPVEGPESKGLYTPTIDNTGVVGPAERPESTLRSGQNGQV